MTVKELKEIVNSIPENRDSDVLMHSGYDPERFDIVGKIRFDRYVTGFTYLVIKTN